MKILTGIRIAIRVPLNISSFQLILREFGLIRVNPEKMSILFIGAFLYKPFDAFCKSSRDLNETEKEVLSEPFNSPA